MKLVLVSFIIQENIFRVPCYIVKIKLSPYKPMAQIYDMQTISRIPKLEYL